MKLGGKSRDVDSFVDQLKEEGETVSTPSLPSAGVKLTPVISDNTSKIEPYDNSLNVFMTTVMLILN